jgi:hypothetical protein
VLKGLIIDALQAGASHAEVCFKQSIGFLKSDEPR